MSDNAPADSDQSENGRERPSTRLDIGEALRRTVWLLEEIENSGSDLDALTEPEIPDAQWRALRENAQKRENWNPSVFEGETDAFDMLRDVEDEEIRSEAHKLVMFYWRRAKTSKRIATALSDAYGKAMERELSGGAHVDYADFKKKLGELLSVVQALATEHGQIVALAQDARIGDHERTNERYQEQIAPLLADFDAALDEYRALGKVRFKKRKASTTKLKSCLILIEETNKVFEHYDYVDLQTRAMPED